MKTGFTNKWIAMAFAGSLLFSSAAGKENKTYFSKKDLTLVGAYYYPEHWDESQWERDLKKMSEMGFEFTHFAEFAWAQLEPEQGRYEFGWLDRAVELAAKYNLKVILCTSTATPPVWLTRAHPEILIKNEDGTTVDHGARQHASFSSTVYREYSMKMIAELGKRYGHDKRVIGWQLDNEPGVRHDFNTDALNRFRAFLKQKYKQDISVLNKAWGTAFWSQVYSSFEQITFPLPSNWGQNPHQLLDWRRFFAQESASFLDEQAVVLRQYISPDQWITSNYIPNYADGHFGQSKNLDFTSYTRYMVYGDPGIEELGFRIGDPMRIPFANDFTRPIDGVYGVMELQPGQVNWGIRNSMPYPGAVRLWLWSVFAGGSDFTCTYRFRQPLFGDEQFHHGIVGPDGVTPSRGGLEYQKFIEEISLLRKNYNPNTSLPTDYTRRQTGILYNHENVWSLEKRKLNDSWDTEKHIQKYYKALKSFGAPVDVVYEGEDISDYPVLLAPAYELVDDSLIAVWSEYAKAGGHLILTARSGWKDRMSQLFEAPIGAKIAPLIGAEYDFHDFMPANLSGHVEMNGEKYGWHIWGEGLIPQQGTEVWATHADQFYKGSPAVTHRKLGKGTVTYVGVETEDGKLEADVLKRVYALSNTPLMSFPEGVWMEYRDGFGIAVNYSSRNYEFSLPTEAEILIGKSEIEPAGVLVWKVK